MTILSEPRWHWKIHSQFDWVTSELRLWLTGYASVLEWPKGGAIKVSELEEAIVEDRRLGVGSSKHYAIEFFPGTERNYEWAVTELERLTGQKISEVEDGS